VYGPLFTDGANLTTYMHPDINGLVAQAQTEMDEKKRREIYHRINKIWIEDAAAAPLYQQLDLYGANKRLNWKARSDERIQAWDMSLKGGK
jgi:peptide/nickel transport system substrate-binding protein